MSLRALSRSITDRERVYDFLVPKVNPMLTVGHGCLLYLEGLTVSFDGFKAINNLNLYINEGELRCIIGPNGAGKTTMMDIITGKTRPDSGSAWFGQNIDLLELSEPQIAQAGIGLKLKKPTVFEQQTVFHNLELAMAGAKTVRASLFAKLSASDIDSVRGDKCKNIPDFIYELFPVLQQMLHRRGGDLSGGQQQQLAIGRALVINPKLLILDEPTEGIQPNVVAEIGDIIRRLNQEIGLTVLLVEQKLPFARKVADRFSLLDRGRQVASGEMAALSPELVKQYLTV
ncbi:MAG: ATP-binding cassette domain-containing protein [Vibrio sp.]